MSDQAAITDDETISMKASSVRQVTLPWNQTTSPYACNSIWGEILLSQPH